MMAVMVMVFRLTVDVAAAVCSLAATTAAPLLLMLLLMLSADVALVADY